jgi:HEAT repeat protein
MRSSRLAGFALVLVAAGCAQSPSRASNGDSSRADAAPSGPRAISTFPPETQAFMKAGLHQFSKGDPQWESTRAKWLAMGPDEADLLVQLLWTALLRAQASDAPNLVDRARHELAKIGEPAVPLLAAFLAGGTISSSVDPDTGERRDVVVDDLARGQAAEALGVIGAPAVPAVRDALDRAASKAGRIWAMKTLGYIGDRGGASASEPLLRYARDPDDVLRVTAVDALRGFHDDASRATLLASLGDDEDLVRRKAAESLMSRRDQSTVPAIRQAAAHAREIGKLAEAAEMEKAAAWIEKHPK